MWKPIFAAICGFVMLAGCGWAGQTALDQPQPIMPPSDSGAGLDILGQVGDSPSVRFETQAYSGLQQNSFTEIGSDTDPDISPDGRRMIFSSTRYSRTSDLCIKKIDGRAVTRLTDDSANEVQPALSPDGNFIAYASDRAGNWDIFVMATDGRTAFQVTSGLSHDVHPSWSPDGSRLCYSSFNTRSGRWEIWIVEVANPANRKFITYGLFPSWSPAAAVGKIAFQLARRRGARLFSIWTVDLVDGEARFPTEVVPATATTAAIAPGWSPDGKRLVYTTVRLVQDPRQGALKHRPVMRGDNIWITTIDGLTRVKLTREPSSDWCPVWSADGRIYFASNRDGADNIWSLKPLDTNLIQATRVRPTRLGNSQRPVPGAAKARATGEAKVEANGAAM
ncbi:MAG: hypothetical protein GWP05_02780 [Anaerolineaceae bacterium]|nr:hypothetical protein [Anaerolineaceae bacterium]